MRAKQRLRDLVSITIILVHQQWWRDCYRRVHGGQRPLIWGICVKRSHRHDTSMKSNITCTWRAILILKVILMYSPVFYWLIDRWNHELFIPNDPLQFNEDFGKVTNKWLHVYLIMKTSDNLLHLLHALTIIFGMFNLDKPICVIWFFFLFFYFYFYIFQWNHSGSNLIFTMSRVHVKTYKIKVDIMTSSMFV